MNFLAHIYLSGDDPLILTGNFMGDFVKAGKWKVLPKKLGQGVLLHRLIDSSTDEHEVSAELRALLHPVCGKYAGIALDMILDHFLAKDKGRWNTVSLADFAREKYLILQAHSNQMPPGAQRLLHYLVAEDWLTGYASLDYTMHALFRMQNRIGITANFDGVRECLELNNNRFQNGFHRIFTDVERSSSEKLISFDLD